MKNKWPPIQHVLVYLTLLLAVSNLWFMKAYHDQQKLAQAVFQKAKEASSEWGAQKKLYVTGIQAEAGDVFADILDNMKLFKQISEQSEGSISNSLQKRKTYVDSMPVTPSEKLSQAMKLIELDQQILTAYQDYTSLQSMHRKKLIDQLKPLAEKLGIKS